MNYNLSVSEGTVIAPKVYSTKVASIYEPNILYLIFLLFHNIHS